MKLLRCDGRVLDHDGSGFAAFCRLEWLPSMSEKTARCRPFQALASIGKVFLPEQAVWKADLLGQLLRFPADKYDDGVDVCSLIGGGIETDACASGSPI